MATSREIKEKRKSVHSINKITKAMQLVSTAKSQKAVRRMREYQQFYQKIIDIVSDISKDTKQLKEFKGTFWVVIASDLGLAGAYNSNILKTFKANQLKEDKILIIGRKAVSLTNKTEIELLKSRKHSNEVEFFLSSEILNPDNSSKVISFVKEKYVEKNMRVKVIYTKYVSQLEFQTSIYNLLPIDLKKEETQDDNLKKIEFEPSKEELLQEIIDTYIESTLIGLFRESLASEHTSRRVAMENASKNGEDMLKELEIKYNRTRQAKITQEISEIIGGAEALN